MNSYFTFLSRNRVYTFIEAIGMALALGFIILLVAYAKTEFSVGRNLPNANQIYTLGTGDMLGMTLDTPVEFFPQVPEIDTWTRIANGMAEDVVVGDEYFSTTSAFIDSTFFQFFDFRLTGCDRRCVLTDRNEVILSESFARKAFGTEEAIGKRLTVGQEQFTVCGIVQDFGRKDLFQPADIFYSIKRAYDCYQRMDNFGNTLTFLTLKPGADSQAVARKLLKKYTEYWREFYAEDNSTGKMLWGSTLTPFDEVYFSSLNSFTVIKKGNRNLVEVLLLVAFVLLVSACFNYINLSVALTSKRAKEMTMRRLLGAQRWAIVLRYIGEAFVFTAGCFVLGCLVAHLLHPLLEEWLTTTIPLWPDWQTAAVGLFVLLLLSVVSSLLPAMLVLQFRPLDVVKGTFQVKNKMVFSRIFIVVQNVISMTLIAVALTMTLQMHHLLTLPTGYETDSLVFVSSWDIGYKADRQEILRQRLLTLPQVEAVGRMGSVPFHASYNGLHDAEGNTSWICLSSMDTTAFRLLGFRIAERFSAPTDSLCWIDRETQRRYRVSAAHPTIEGDAGGTTGIISMQPQFTVCGVVENYRSGMANYTPKFDDAHNVIRLLAPDDWSWCYVVKVRGDRTEAISAIRKACTEVAQEVTGYSKELPCDYVDDLLRDALSQERHTMQLVLCFMFLSILISALGLFAMSMNYCEQHSREIALRRIMGASVRSAVGHLSWPFVLLSLVAIALAAPLSVFIMERYLREFYYAIPFPWFVIPLSALLALAVVVLSVLGQTLRIATRNPIEGIKTE